MLPDNPANVRCTLAKTAPVHHRYNPGCHRYHFKENLVGKTGRLTDIQNKP
jgi:hypothetical protein